MFLLIYQISIFPPKSRKHLFHPFCYKFGSWGPFIHSIPNIFHPTPLHRVGKGARGCRGWSSCGLPPKPKAANLLPLCHRRLPNVFLFHPQKPKGLRRWTGWSTGCATRGCSRILFGSSSYSFPFPHFPIVSRTSAAPQNDWQRCGRTAVFPVNQSRTKSRCMLHQVFVAPHTPCRIPIQPHKICVNPVNTAINNVLNCNFRMNFFLFSSQRFVF